MTVLLERVCRSCKKLDFATLGDACHACNAPYGRLDLGYDTLLDPNDAEAPAWPIGSRISTVIRRACGLSGKAP